MSINPRSMYYLDANPSLPNSCSKKEGVVLFSLRALPSRRCLVGYTTLPISFLPSSRTSLSGLAASHFFPSSSSSRICTLSPSFQVIDVLSLRRIHQHGGILRRSEEASQEGLGNNSALSSFLSGVADVLSSPFFPSSRALVPFADLEGATAYMVPLIAKCGIIQVAPPASA